MARRWASRPEAVEVERKLAVVLDGKEDHEGPANEVEEQRIIQDELSKLVARIYGRWVARISRIFPRKKMGSGEYAVDTMGPAGASPTPGAGNAAG